MPSRNKAHRLWTALVVHRFALLAVVDATAWGSGLLTGVLLRFDLDPDRADVTGIVRVVTLAAAVQLVAGVQQGLYLGRWRLGSFDEVRAMTLSVVVTAAALLAVNGSTRWIPLRAMLMGVFVTLVLMAGSRYSWRLSIERRRRPDAGIATRILVFGAGEGGSQILTAMLSDPHSPYLPVVLADDDLRKTHLRLRGVPVGGTRHDIAALAAQHRCEALLIAVPSADAALVREISELGRAAGLAVRVLPPVRELFDDAIELTDIRPLTETDLLGRREIDTDVGAIASYLQDRRVLVTGAGGSIGSELCRQIMRFDPARLVMVDRDESALHAVQLSIDGRALLEDPDLVVADLRDRPRMVDIFATVRPQVVFHAAALKHLPLLELHPAEGVKTNVIATATLLEVSLEHGVERFVNISTDKAADPCSILGYTKRITERLTAAAARGQAAYMSVRFGNVLGSRGSVLTTFRAQIAAGGPVTVTHPDVTRYFMTVEEAVQLVIQAGAIGGEGDVLVLDMGEPVRIADVARQLVDQVDRPVEITFTGLRLNEKLHEHLLGDQEWGDVRGHPLIRHVAVPPLETYLLDRLDPDDAGSLARALAEVATWPPADHPAAGHLS